MGMFFQNVLRYLAGAVFGILLVKGGLDMEAVNSVIRLIGDDPEIAGLITGFVMAGVEIYRKLRAS